MHSSSCYGRYNHRYNQHDEFPGPDGDDELLSKVIDNQNPSNFLREMKALKKKIGMLHEEFPGPESDDELPSKVVDNEIPSNIVREMESKIGSCVDLDFWLTLLGCSNSGWLTDKQLDIWCDLMWYFRQADVDWDIASPYFCPLVMGKDVPFWPTNKAETARKRIGNVSKIMETDRKRFSGVSVAFPFPGRSQTGTACLQAFRCFTGLGVLPIEKRKWWKKMRLTFENVIPTYLDECGVLKAKCISLETYKIKFEVA
nr:hypothetical protein [Tanacetum cinerariifolium]